MMCSLYSDMRALCRKTSGEQMIYFTSDQHFGHTNIIKYCNRPFEFSREGTLKCDEFIRDKYCSVVREDDIVFFLGDIALFKRADTERIKELISNLPGQKILLKGNHDHNKNHFYRSCGFLDVRHYLNFGDYFICHYPLTFEEEEINQRVQELKHLYDINGCSVVIHGHTHEKFIQDEEGIRRINVCVDNPQTRFMPVKVEGIPEQQIIEYVNSIKTSS